MCDRPARPHRPIALAIRRQAFLREVLQTGSLADALAEGLVAFYLDGEGLSYVLTPLGKAWMRDFPKDALVYGRHDAGCPERA